MRCVYGNLAKSIIRLRATASSRCRLAGRLVPYVLFVAIIGGCTTLPQQAPTADPQRPSTDYRALIPYGYSCLPIAGAYQNAGTERNPDGSDGESLLTWHVLERYVPQATRVVLSETPSSNANEWESTLSVRLFMDGTAEPPVPAAFHCSGGWWVRAFWSPSWDKWEAGAGGVGGSGRSQGVRFRKGTDGSLIVVRFVESYDVLLLYGIVPLKAEFHSVTIWYRFPPAPDQ